MAAKTLRSKKHLDNKCWNQLAISTGPSTIRRTVHTSNFLALFQCLHKHGGIKTREINQYPGNIRHTIPLSKNNKSLHCRTVRSQPAIKKGKVS